MFVLESYPVRRDDDLPTDSPLPPTADERKRRKQCLAFALILLGNVFFHVALVILPTLIYGRSGNGSFEVFTTWYFVLACYVPPIVTFFLSVGAYGMLRRGLCGFIVVFLVSCALSWLHFYWILLCGAIV
jgi:hypothetical protein